MENPTIIKRGNANVVQIDLYGQEPNVSHAFYQNTLIMLQINARNALKECISKEVLNNAYRRIDFLHQIRVMSIFSKILSTNLKDII